MSVLNEKVARDLKALGLMEGCEREYKFHPTRRWKADFAWISEIEADCDCRNCGNQHFSGGIGGEASKRIMLEVNGGTYMQGKSRGAHSRGSRQREDYEKWSEASLMGWTVLLVDSKDVREGVHVERVLRALGRA